MCMFRRLKEKPSYWVNYYEYNTIEVGKGVVYTKADGSQYMDGKVLKIIGISLQYGETVIKLETDTNILVGPINKGKGFIPNPESYYNEEVM